MLCELCAVLVTFQYMYNVYASSNPNALFLISYFHSKILFWNVSRRIGCVWKLGTERERGRIAATNCNILFRRSPFISDWRWYAIGVIAQHRTTSNDDDNDAEKIVSNNVSLFEFFNSNGKPADMKIWYTLTQPHTHTVDEKIPSYKINICTNTQTHSPTVHTHPVNPTKQSFVVVELIFVFILFVLRFAL